MRNSYTISWGNAKATLEFSRSSDAEAFENNVNELSNTHRSGRWWFVVDSITFGVDWPIWWERYQALRNRYRGLLEEDINLRDLKLSAKLRKKEMWRRYDLYAQNRIATCESVHYPDFYETSEMIKPAQLDGWRERFPSGSFGQYVMSSPPNGRLIDLSDTGDYDQVWSDHQSFFVEHDMLVNGSAIPASVVAAYATNQDLRAFFVATWNQTKHLANPKRGAYRANVAKGTGCHS